MNTFFYYTSKITKRKSGLTHLLYIYMNVSDIPQYVGQTLWVPLLKEDSEHKVLKYLMANGYVQYLTSNNYRIRYLK